MTDLGYQNQWDEKISGIVLDCRSLGHETVDINLNERRTLTKRACLVCGYYYLVDSSD